VRAPQAEHEKFDTDFFSSL